MPEQATQPVAQSPEFLKALAECNTLHLRLVAIDREREEIRTKLDQMWRLVPALPVPRYRICMNCREFTLERFSGKGHTGCTCCTPMCIKHSKSKDRVAMALLAELVNGDSL